MSAAELTARIHEVVAHPLTGDAGFDIHRALRDVLVPAGLRPEDSGGRITFNGSDPIVPSTMRLGAVSALGLTAKSSLSTPTRSACGGLSNSSNRAGCGSTCRRRSRSSASPTRTGCSTAGTSRARPSSPSDPAARPHVSEAQAELQIHVLEVFSGGSIEPMTHKHSPRGSSWPSFKTTRSSHERGELWRISGEVASGLAHQGDPARMCRRGSTPEPARVRLRASRGRSLGRRVLSVPPDYRAREIEFIFRFSEAHTLVVPDRFTQPRP
ncbi:hypothetical protein M2283_009377 [Streptomyces pseudovenezuelae]|uniref:Uncharacterized protein n=1 Tax=Streptomyces pseudovenezuelae TaxID=67350 RepID=A0ABT6M0E9_9ACTN|nr:hypothetical protein [Streptomyces pseudovenezuelae]